MRPVAIPVTTVGGYLGAGKTTFVNAVLAGAHGRRIGVLVNDFGAVSIDARLVIARDADLVTLANGCACCSVAGDLGEALDRLAAKSAPEHILIEASGVADPAKIAALARAPGLAPQAPIVLADAETLVQRASDKFVGRLVRSQLSQAGVVLLTKLDLVGALALERARNFVRREAPHAEHVEWERGEMDLSRVLDRPATTATQVSQRFEIDEPAEAVFSSHSWRTKSMLDDAEVRDAFERLPDSVVRAKGLFATPRGDLFEIHRVGGRTGLSQRTAGASRAAGGADFVFIAHERSIDAAALDAAMNECIAKQEY